MRVQMIRACIPTGSGSQTHNGAIIFGVSFDLIALCADSLGPGPAQRKISSVAGVRAPGLR